MPAPLPKTLGGSVAGMPMPFSKTLGGSLA